MKKTLIALFIAALIFAGAHPAHALLARAERIAPAPAASVDALALFTTLRDTLARILFDGDASRLSTIERILPAPTAPAPLNLDRAADFLRRG